jgi:hypothetical protein
VSWGRGVYIHKGTTNYGQWVKLARRCKGGNRERENGSCRFAASNDPLTIIFPHPDAILPFRELRKYVGCSSRRNPENKNFVITRNLRTSERKTTKREGRKTNPLRFVCFLAFLLSFVRGSVISLFLPLMEPVNSLSPISFLPLPEGKGPPGSGLPSYTSFPKRR